jgi:SAM-dependent methyltransferase
VFGWNEHGDMRPGEAPAPMRGVLRKLRHGLARLVGYKYLGGNFGVREAIVFCASVDVWRRYSAVADVLRSLAGASCGCRPRVLDVGSGPGDIMLFLPSDRWDVCLLDKDPKAVASCGGRCWRIVGDARRLPFSDEAFDYVVSVDCLEHLPASERGMVIGEMRRVARRAVIIHVPMSSDDGLFVAADCDRRYQYWHRRILGFEEPNISEHLQMGVPSLGELKGLLPEAEFSGVMNARAWLNVMVLSRTPLTMLLAGFAYLLCIRRQDEGPPFYGSLVVWIRRPPVGHGARASRRSES